LETDSQKRWAEGGGFSRHFVFVCIKLYQTGRHPLFLCERTRCTVGHNKPSLQQCEPQNFIA